MKPRCYTLFSSLNISRETHHIIVHCAQRLPESMAACRAGAFIVFILIYTPTSDMHLLNEFSPEASCCCAISSTIMPGAPYSSPSVVCFFDGDEGGEAALIMDRCVWQQQRRHIKLTHPPVISLHISRAGRGLELLLSQCGRDVAACVCC